MKNFILINGTMGAGKTTVSRALQKLLPQAVFLDGDWCWDSDPFLVTDETKKMVLENIAFLLSQFLACKAYQNVIFCWVMHEREILSDLLSRLDTKQCEEVLRARLRLDIERGLRDTGVIERSLARLGGYAQMDTKKLNTDTLSPEEAAGQIAAML